MNKCYNFAVLFRRLEEFAIDISFYILRKSLGWSFRLVWIKEVAGLQDFPRTGAVILAFN